ncbi:hypothetical protein VNO78_03375 [Psophocarpus tetragonolobus]|uniref:Uncharacterized protein n=1 Tax=Psophocarpus tetragonolobus TaxID=3891 RepID=A0AAN9XVW2_PSOTE
MGGLSLELEVRREEVLEEDGDSWARTIDQEVPIQSNGEKESMCQLYHEREKLQLTHPFVIRRELMLEKEWGHPKPSANQQRRRRSNRRHMASLPLRSGSILHEVQVVQVKITNDNYGGYAVTDSSIGDTESINHLFFRVNATTLPGRKAVSGSGLALSYLRHVK